MDMAVGVIVGGAFKTIVDSLVNDILMPLLSLLTGNISFETMVLIVGDTTVIPYGSFLSAVLNFLIMAMVLFCIIRTLNRFHKKKDSAPPAAPVPSKEELLLTEIRDLLKERDA